MARVRDHISTQGPLSHRAAPSLDIHPSSPLVRHGRSEFILVEEQEPNGNSAKTQQPWPEPPVSQDRAPVIPEPIRKRSRFNHHTHDASLSKRGETPGSERSPSVRPPEHFLSESLYNLQPPAAPARLGGGDPPPGSTNLYTQHWPEGIVRPPSVIDSQPGQPGAPAQGLRYTPMPPGPVIIQLPLSFDTLMAKLQEHRLAQLATVDQQRELMMYMSGWNDWLTRDLQDRQAVITRVNQLREDLGRLGVGAGPSVSIPGSQLQPRMGQPTGVDGLVVLPVPPAPGGSVPPVVLHPVAFFPQGGPQPPIVPGMDQLPCAHFPVVPAVPAGWGMPMPDSSQNVGRTGPVLPAGTPDGEYHRIRPSQYVHHTEEPGERVIPSTSSPGYGTMIVPPSPGHDSRNSTPDQQSYLPHGPGALPAPLGGVPSAFPVDSSIGGHQTIINIPQIEAPGHTVELIPLEPSLPSTYSGVVVQPSLQGTPTGPIVSHPPTLGPSVPVAESVHVTSRTSSSASTSYATIPSERGEHDCKLSFSMEDAPEPPHRHPSPGSAIGDDWNDHQRMSSRAASMLPADLDNEQSDHLAHEHLNDLGSGPSSPSSRTATYLGSSQSSILASRRRSHASTTNSRGHLLERLVSIEEAVHEINTAAKNRERSDQELARLREESKLYKLQLENAQKEILRARDIIDQVNSQRNEAEAEAARVRTLARKLHEEKLVTLARKEGREMGYQVGLSMGRRAGYNEGYRHGDPNVPEATSDGEGIELRSHVQLRSDLPTRQQLMCSELVPSVRTTETALHAPPPPAPLRVVPARVRMPFYEHRTPSPPHDLDEPETIHTMPITSNQSTGGSINSGWTSRADSRTSYICVPTPDELWQPIPSPSSITIEAQERRATQQSEPTPVSPSARSHDYDQTSVSPAISRGHSPSIASHTLTHTSQYHLATKRPGNSLRNMIDVGRAKNGNQPLMESTSRDDRRDQDRRHSSRTEVESIVKQWQVNDDSSLRNHPVNPWLRSRVTRVPTESAALRLHPLLDDLASQPTPLGDVNDPQPRRFVKTKSTAAHSRPLPDPPMSLPARTGFPPDNLRQPRRDSDSSNSILNTIIELPSRPDTIMSLSATVADTLSPEARHRLLPRGDAHQHRPSHSRSQSQFSSRHDHPSSSYETRQPPGTTSTPQAVGFIPSPPGHGITTSKPGPGPGRDHRRALSHPTSASAPDRNVTPLNDHVRTHAQSTWELESDGDRDGENQRRPS